MLTLPYACLRSAVTVMFSRVCQVQDVVKYLTGVVELLEAHFLGSWTPSAVHGSKRELILLPGQEFYFGKTVESSLSLCARAINRSHACAAQQAHGPFGPIMSGRFFGVRYS